MKFYSATELGSKADELARFLVLYFLFGGLNLWIALSTSAATTDVFSLRKSSCIFTTELNAQMLVLQIINQLHN